METPNRESNDGARSIRIVAASFRCPECRMAFSESAPRTAKSVIFLRCGPSKPEHAWRYIEAIGHQSTPDENGRVILESSR